jgi:hypothetical protein
MSEVQELVVVMVGGIADCAATGTEAERGFGVLAPGGSEAGPASVETPARHSRQVAWGHTRPNHNITSPARSAACTKRTHDNSRLSWDVICSGKRGMSLLSGLGTVEAQSSPQHSLFLLSQGMIHRARTTTTCQVLDSDDRMGQLPRALLLQRSHMETLQRLRLHARCLGLGSHVRQG